jgi:hypothetical protein
MSIRRTGRWGVMPTLGAPKLEMRVVTPMLLCAALAAGCRSTANRPVEEQGDAAELWSLLHRPAPASVSVDALDLVVRTGGPMVGEAAPVRVTSAPLPLDPGKLAEDIASEPPAPVVDLGLPILVDFGVGEAPYDDATTQLHRGALGSGGFSSSVLSVVWRRPLPRGFILQGQASLVRDQDLSLLDGLGDARFGFAVLGLCVSF